MTLDNIPVVKIVVPNTNIPENISISDCSDHPQVVKLIPFPGTGQGGPAGAQGITGSTGLQGIQGLSGNIGIQGRTGSQGITGSQGAIGIQGSIGFQGTSGQNGLQGITGQTGFQGTVGLQGQVGLQGSFGSQGTVGLQGLQGLFGIQGIQGLIGPQGDPGIVSGITSVIQHEVKAGEALVKGQAVYVTYADGTNMIVSKASNAGESTSSKTMGLITSNLAHNDIGYVITEGLLEGLDTSTANAGDPVWLGTDGNLIYGLTNKPHAPQHLVFIGIITRVQQNNGEIFVKVQNGFELEELHNLILTDVQNGDAVVYDSTIGKWKNSSISTSSISGLQGTNGVQGIQGLTGSSGTNGVQGIQGLTGSSGTNGVQGIQGLTGSSGTNGVQGIQGLQGMQGTHGTQGISGTGIQGVQGLTGLQGATAGITYKAGIPASPTSTGTVGQLSIDGVNGVLYVCTSTNVWQKVSLNSANFTNVGGFV